MAEGRLTGKVAIVTGASRGIGRSVAERFAAEGEEIVLGQGRAASRVDGRHDEFEVRRGDGAAEDAQPKRVRGGHLDLVFDTEREELLEGHRPALEPRQIADGRAVVHFRG